MKNRRFLLKIKVAIAKFFYSIFNPIDSSVWRAAIRDAESFEYKFSFGNYICFASLKLNMTAIYNPASGLVVLCCDDYMIGPSNRSFSQYLGSLLGKIEIREFSFPIIPPDTMLFSVKQEEDVTSLMEENRASLDESSKKFATEFYKKNFGFIPENIEPDILYFYTSGYREGYKNILEKYLKLPFIKIKNDRP